MLIAAIFIIAVDWKQLGCPSMSEWFNKPWYIPNMEYYSAVKKKKEETTDAHSNLGESPENYAE